ncbi:DEAD/DEAH box helicase [Shewanella sp. TC10]|uniref:DEAD/DEAH box helicase n=1 Tax=Shewanella sp. TC10 TaxID=1419739 RepID=UPI00129DD502|nr:DEAD/DEAH box helicase family protein [Shewanella sp. TC10]
MQFQVAPNVFEKTSYTTKSVTNLIEDIKCLKIPNQGVTYEDLVINYGSQFCDLTKQIKQYNPYLFPYSVKDQNEKLVADNIDKLQFLVLDIDDSCTIEQFIKCNTDYKYYLHTTTTHRVAGVDKFRVIFPITEPMDIADAISRKAAIQDYFSFGGDTYLDTSFLIKGRGFVVPVELDHYFEYETQTSNILDLSSFAKGASSVKPTGKKVDAIEGMDNSPEVIKLAQVYMDACENSVITVNNRKCSRNDAFFFLHAEIAKHRVSEEFQIALAHKMNWDQKRNTVQKTVDEARKYCRSIDISALKKKSTNYKVETKKVTYLQADDVQIKDGKKHLLTATTGTGKTTLVLDKMDRKVIFAAPLNSIVEQQSHNRTCVTLTGCSGVLPSGDKIICSYNALIALLDKNDLSDYLIVLDEFHRVLSDGFRLDVMSGLIERLKAKSYTVLCMSGTFDPTHLDCFKFDYHFDFKADRPTREITVLETTGTLDNALVRFLKNLNPLSNNLVLFDDKKKALAIEKVLSNIEVISSDSKEDDCHKQILALGEIKGTVITTQVLLEGINLKGIDNIIIVASKYWSEEQIVQFYERDRDRSAKCYLVKKPTKDIESYIPDAYKEKEYQNQFYNEVNNLGVDKLKLLGARDMEKLIRIEGSQIYMNLLYPYHKQKSAMDVANFRKGLTFEKYDYSLTTDVESISSSTVAALDKVKNLSKEVKSQSYAQAVEKALNRERYDEDHDSVFNMVTLLLDNGFDKEEVREIALKRKELGIYKDRLLFADLTLERAIYKQFVVGEYYTAIDAKAIITKTVTNSPQVTVRVNPNHYLKILNRYFHIKRKPTKKGVVIVSKREVNNVQL